MAAGMTCLEATTRKLVYLHGMFSRNAPSPSPLAVVLPGRSHDFELEVEFLGGAVEVVEEDGAGEAILKKQTTEIVSKVWPKLQS